MTAPRLAATDQQLLVLAFSITEWDTILAHLLALRLVGCHVPEEAMTAVMDEFTNHTAWWATYYEQEGTPLRTSHDTAVHAREWLSQHREDLEELLRERSEARD
jgi:hypothetical protein